MKPRVHLIRRLGFHEPGDAWVISAEVNLFEACALALNHYCRGWREAELEILTDQRLSCMRAFRRGAAGSIEFEHP